MGNEVGVSLLVSIVLLDKVKVVSSDDDGISHLMGYDHSSEDLSSYGNVAGEGTLLIDIVSFDGLLRGLETETDFSEVSGDFFVLGDQELLVASEDSLLLLVAVFSLLDHMIDL